MVLSSFFFFIFKSYLKLVFTIVDKKNTNSHQLFTRKIYFIQKKESLAAYFAGAFVTSPVFDPLFESRKCWLIFNSIIKGVPEEAPSKGQ